MKKCSKCGELKDESEFSNDSSKKDNLYSSCKECSNKKNKKYRNNERGKKQRKRYVDSHKNELRQYLREYRKTYDQDKEKRTEYMKKYKEKNKKTLRKKRREDEKNRCANNIQYKLAKKLRNRLWDAVKHNYKNGSAVKDLGCTLVEFVAHLESKFYPHPETGEEMTWDNYGFYGWHLDHIIPLSAFDLTRRDHIIFACHYTNLQPMWAEENLSKGAKIEK